MYHDNTGALTQGNNGRKTKNLFDNRVPLGFPKNETFSEVRGGAGTAGNPVQVGNTTFM